MYATQRDGHKTSLQVDTCCHFLMDMISATVRCSKLELYLTQMTSGGCSFNLFEIREPLVERKNKRVEQKDNVVEKKDQVWATRREGRAKRQEAAQRMVVRRSDSPLYSLNNSNSLDIFLSLTGYSVEVYTVIYHHDIPHFILLFLCIAAWL